MMNEIKDKLLKNIRPLALCAVALLGIVLIAASAGEEKSDAVTLEDSYSKLDTYTEDVEKRLTAIIENIEGAGDTAVMISFESSFESVYANNARLEENTSQDVTQSAKTTEKQIVLAGDNANGESPILLKELCPRVKGVLVVCEGGNNERVCSNVKEAVTALFGISQTKIHVTVGEGRGG